MTKSEAPVVVAGAGIGGLTAALALYARGIRAIVVDRAQQLEPLGVGINLLPHAVRELHRLGLGAALADIAVAPEYLRYVDARGAEIYVEPRGVAGGYGHPQLSVHRGRLQSLLLSAVHARLGADSVRTGTAVTGFRQCAEGVRVDTVASEVTAAALIGADGLHSTVRRQLHPDGDPLLWSGIQMYRGATTAPAFLDGRSMVIVVGDDGVSMVLYRIGDDLLNWVLQVPAGTPGPFTGPVSSPEPVDADAVARHVASWSLGWLDAAALIRRTHPVTRHAMVDRDPLPWWTAGRVTLLGDAAHPMYPVGANGASQAVVDGAVLAAMVDRHGIPAGLARYAVRRRPDTARVVYANRAMHAAGGNTAAGLAHITTSYRNTTSYPDDLARSTRS
ncbi:FAD-dependent monooxygenase [Mycobacterium sp. MYCO198283]|uniref:FAD-dependent monooxygenase n=1 Tax=Mycobacterium sp. MYCO198283 TaxID=2883505 RepID=UPI001E53884F|nr:FAD-dependent monooxygenase [Mycobacterium sp. MYCO198283]MCG5433468.1 FAD-dependent monooxygenase [Mycobacterium sp. MYCO198283]